MHARVLTVFLAVALTCALTLTRGQDRPAASTPKPVVVPTASTAARPMPPLPDSPLARQMLLSAQRGAEWLFRMHGVKGRFVPGYLPALKQELETDHFQRQAEAAAALARVARFVGEDRYTARAAQAVLALLEDTADWPAQPGCRVVSLPGDAATRLAAAASLVVAINELPAPQSDLLERSEQLCRGIAKTARPDGSFAGSDAPSAALALWAVVKSHKHRPAAWKLALARKAVAFYHPAFAKDHRTDAAHAFTAASTEAYAITKEKAFADFAFAIQDWVCGLQYNQIDPRRLAWYGGFMAYQGGRAVESAPDAQSASLASGLVEGGRMARLAGDLARHQQYGEVLERSLQFLATLQYTEAGTQHFASWYRPRIVGGFHASPTDGDLRIDHTAAAVTALAGYVEQQR